MSLDTLLQSYKDGDEHGWAEEFRYLMSEHGERIRSLTAAIQAEGIREPILLGNDGRVWDGHHRLCVASRLGIHTVPVQYTL